MMLLEAGAVHRQWLTRKTQQTGRGEVPGEPVQRAIDASFLKNQAERAPQRVMIRRDAQADVLQPGRTVPQELFRASITEAEELTQNQTGKELGERKGVARESGGMIRQ
jgi:hypothetical protein